MELPARCRETSTEAAWCSFWDRYEMRTRAATNSLHGGQCQEIGALSSALIPLEAVASRQFSVANRWARELRHR